MRKKLESELKKLANKILNMQEQEDIVALKTEVRMIYEKLIVLEFMETLAGKSDAMKKFQELAANVISENTQVPENNPHQEDLVEPVMYKIKDLVNEMLKEETLDDVLSDVQPNPVFIKKEKNETVSRAIADEKISEPRKLSLNDILKKQINIGLNDSIGFVKHLFNGSEEDFNKVLTQLNTMDNRAEARNFIVNIVKPDYNDWQGKEDYEARFLAIIDTKFDD